MNKAIIRYRNAIIALIMIAVNGVGASASTPWTVNPGDFRYDMSLYLDMAFAVSDMDYTLYDVGVFSGDECRGIAERLPLGNGSECLYLRARSNQENGETMTFRYRDKETGEELPVDGVSFTFESDGRLGYPSDPYKVKIIRHYDVVFSAGEGGSVDNEGGRLAEGTGITLTATPDEGYHFNGWSDGVTENPRQIIVDGDIALSAQFAVNSYSLTYVVDGEAYRQLTVDFGTVIVPEETPQKEGHTFSGWEGLPQTMPAHDVTVTGVFTINSYNAVFRIGNDVIDTKVVVFGQPVTPPDAPEKEGHTFNGWANVPETMPANDIEIEGSYSVNSYSLTYVVDGETYRQLTVDFGTEIVPEETPQKEGHTFSGWEGLPQTMPAHDVTVTGVFTINSYNAVFRIGDDVIDTKVVVFGQPVTPPDAPEKEGHTFNGWANVPETMPANDIEIEGSYSVNSYSLTYVVDGVTYRQLTVDFGTEIVPEETPQKEGHSFSGWEGLPQTMPAHDVTVTGVFTINSYTLTVYLDGELFHSEVLEFGAAIEIPVPEVAEGWKFDGWQEEIPETMPAYDLEIHGTTSELSHLEAVRGDASDKVTIFTIEGVKVAENASYEAMRDRLTPGIYIVNGRKVAVR